MQYKINSVGIDIGTSTTQLIFSKLTIENMASMYAVPRIKIIETNVFYKSDIYFTPLMPNGLDIDANKVKDIVMGEYKKAKVDPKDLQTGAVIITGESARKENANEVLEALSDMAGDFVVATAGPDLESVLAARGAGTDVKSEEEIKTIVNLDIGGGTSNLAAFHSGNLIGTSCLDIGGRLIKVENGKITYIYTKTEKLAKEHGLEMHVGDRADETKIHKLTDIMAKQLAMAVGLIPADSDHAGLYTNEGKKMQLKVPVDGVTFSGGVADVIYNPVAGDPYRYGDIGPILADSIRNCQDFKSVEVYDVEETIRATVVGAGSHATNVSGSTIRYDEGTLPIKNIPVVKMLEEDENDLSRFPEVLADKIDVFENGGTDEVVAIGLRGYKYKHFDDIQDLADAIIASLGRYNNPDIPLVVVIENDIAKALGNALKLRMDKRRKLICIDSIFARDGDYIDIGEPVANGTVLPVITKTLIFNH
ncbi:MAG: ethanolamine ammonia-lyase reactivating factor EutA [Anaerovoracaceae bacterium]|jgi:ethanolamine utilization protein EutA